MRDERARNDTVYVTKTFLDDEYRADVITHPNGQSYLSAEST